MAIKVSVLAKELGISSDDILEQLHKLYVDADDQDSKIDEKIAGLIQTQIIVNNRCEVLNAVAGMGEQKSIQHAGFSLKD